MERLKRTPVFEAYPDNAKIVDFHGWELPVQFSGIIAEHEAVRSKAGLFDVSHMGELEISGPDALSLIQRITTNDASCLKIGEAQYSFMCYPSGGTVDDLLVYRLAEEKFLLVVNASNIEVDEEWIRQHHVGDVMIQNRSEELALLALQGPRAEKILQRLTTEDLSLIKPFQFRQDVCIEEASVLISRTGYTGEDGFELYVDARAVVGLWNHLLDRGKEDGLMPCGLGARDTLRLEACLSLYGQELSSSITPIEAGVGFAVKGNKGEFIGRDVLIGQKEGGPPRKLVGIEMVERGIPRSQYPVFAGMKQVGEVTSGTHSPTLGKNIGLALIDADIAKIGGHIAVGIRGKQVKAEMVSVPFYRRMRGKVGQTI